MSPLQLRRCVRLIIPASLIPASLIPVALVVGVAGCSSNDDSDTPAPTTRPSTVTSLVGGAGVELEPGSNLPPTEAERSGDGTTSETAVTSVAPGSIEPDD
jgi:hypothetical protein